MKKRIVFICFLTIAILLFAACSASQRLENKYIGSDSPVELCVDGSANYSIVRPEKCEATILSAASFTMKQLRTTFGCSYSSVVDSKEEIGNEILIGNTNRKESGFARELLEAKGGRSEDYIICVIDTKICILGMTDDATKAAAEYFIENYGKQSSVDQKLCYYKVADKEAYNEIKLGDTTKLFKYNIVRARYNVSYMEHSALEELSDYLFEQTGYKVNIVKDSLADETEYEIILGETTRGNYKEISDYDTYTITPVDNKVYINGGNTYSRAIAVSEYLKMIKNGEELTETVTGSYAETVKGYDDSFYKLTWMDEFDGTALDTDMWIVTDITSANRRGVLRYDGMKSYRLGANVFVEDGKLVEQATYDDKAYYGAYIINNGNMSYWRGYTEASMKIPYGDGIWTSFWLTNDEMIEVQGDFGVEVNMTECLGGNHVSPNYHRHITKQGADKGFTHTSLDNGYSAVKGIYLPEGEYFHNQFHTYGFMWQGDKAFFTFDGEIHFTYVFGSHDVYGDTKALEHDIDAFDEDPIAYRITMAVGFQGDPIKGADYWKESNKQVVEYCHLFQNEESELNFY